MGRCVPPAVKGPAAVRVSDQKFHRTEKARIRESNKKGNTVEIDRREKEASLNVERKEAVNTALFLSVNEQLGPPYRVLADTNFFNKCLQEKLDPFTGIERFLVARVTIYVTDCVRAELEKNVRFRLAMRLAKDPRIKKLKCDHKGVYADDCLVQRVNNHRCYIVGTNDKELKGRLRKIPGVPLLYVGRNRFGVERLPNSLADVGYTNKK